MKFTILNQQHIHKGFCGLSLLELQYEQFNGEQGPVLHRELLSRKPAVAAVLYDPDTHMLVFVQQFRVGMIKDKQAPWPIEVVAGLIDHADDDPEDTVIREVKEETGLTVLALKPVFNFYTSPGGSDEWVHLYCARVDSTKAKSFQGLASEHEDIKVHILHVDTVQDMLSRHEFNNAFSLLGLQWFFSHKAELDSQWQ